MLEPKWADQMTWKEFSDMLKETDVAIVPVGVMEEHGLHGPFGTDTFIAEEIAFRLAKRVKSILMPSTRYSNNKLNYDISMWPGCISISPETMISLWTDIGTELARFGIKRIVFVNGHFCNQPLVKIAAFNIWNKTGTAVGILEWFAVAMKERLEEFGAKPGAHADEQEMSVLLATKAAKFMDLEKAVANPSPYTKEEEELRARNAFWGTQTIALDKRYLSESGNFGNPKLADKNIGEKIINVTVEVGVKLVESLKEHVKR